MSGILVFLGDFKHARRFASEILRARLHTRNRTNIREVTHLALNTALVVSYGRPFFRNDGLGDGVSSLKSYVATVLTDRQDRDLHEKILLLRKTAYAHSDGASHLIPGFNYNGTGLKFTKDAFVLLDKSETRRLRTISDLWIAYLEAERVKLKTSVS
jgi:hypothetical protein